MSDAGETEPDIWTRRARPSFLYVIYALLLWSIPMGQIAGIDPDMAAAITSGMHAYLNAGAALRALWHGVSGLYRRARLGEGEGQRAMMQRGRC